MPAHSGAFRTAIAPISTLDEISSWMQSLDAVEAVMAWENDFGEDDLPALFDRPGTMTFRQLVQRVALRRRLRR